MFTTDFELVDNTEMVRKAYRKFFYTFVIDESSPRIRELNYLGIEVGEEYCNNIEYFMELGGPDGVNPGRMSWSNPSWPIYEPGRNYELVDIGKEVYYLAKKKIPSGSEWEIMRVCDFALYVIGHFWKYGFGWLMYVAERKLQEFRECGYNPHLRERAGDLRWYAAADYKHPEMIRKRVYDWETNMEFYSEYLDLSK